MKKILVYTLLVILLTGCSQASNQEVSPENITIIAPGSVGGGWDATARAIQDILTSNNLIEGDIEVTNIVGAGGEQGWKFIKNQKGHVLAMNSSLLITNHLLGQSQITYKDFTPIATLATEWEVVIVPIDSAISSANMLMAHLKSAPQDFQIGVSPRLGNDDQLSFILASRKAGITPEQLRFFVYKNSAEVVAALLAGQIDVATMSLSEAKKYYELGQVKMLVISSSERIEGFPEIPTWEEEGLDLVFEHWRGLMGPPNMTKNEIKYWDRVIEKMVKTEEWQNVLQSHMWKDFYKNSSETSEFLKKQEKMYKSLMGVKSD